MFIFLSSSGHTVVVVHGHISDYWCVNFNIGDMGGVVNAASKGTVLFIWVLHTDS